MIMDFGCDITTCGMMKHKIVTQLNFGMVAYWVTEFVVFKI